MEKTDKKETVKRDKYYKEIEKNFLSNNEKVILHTLDEIRKTGRAEIIPLMFDLLEIHTNDKITDEVFSILDQIKDREAVPYIISEITKKRCDRYRTRLITTCWQSGIDYSAYLLLFAENFVKGDYQIAIEAFSVIEENIHNSSDKIISECKDYLVNNIMKDAKEKRALHLELVKLVESYL